MPGRKAKSNLLSSILVVGLVLLAAGLVVGATLFVLTSAKDSDNSTRCVTTNNSIGCTTIVHGTTVGGSCQILPLGKGLYIHLLSDQGQPLADASLGVYFASPFCPNVQVSETVQGLSTNATGWTNYDLDGAGRYNVTVYPFSPNSQSFTVLEKAGQTTYVTIMLPSGNMTSTYRS